MALHAYALTTLAKVKDQLGITTTEYDTVLEELINASTDYIETYCRRRFFDDGVDKTEYADGDGTDMLLVPNYPINSLTSVEYLSAFDNFTALDSGDIAIDPAGLFVRLRSVSDVGKQNYKVTYQAGYTVIPSDLEQACIQMVVSEFKGRKGGGSDIESESIGDYRITYRAGGENIGGGAGSKDNFIDSTLARYKKPKF